MYSSTAGQVDDAHALLALASRALNVKVAYCHQQTAKGGKNVEKHVSRTVVNGVMNIHCDVYIKKIDMRGRL